MIKTRLEETSVRDFLAMNTIVESFQGAIGTGRHTQTQSEAIILSLLRGDDIGVITLATTENDGEFSRLDGNSRFFDLRKFIDGETTIKWMNAEEKKVATKFNELDSERQKKILNGKIHLFIYEGLTVAQRAEKFVHLNSSKTLTAVQKNKGIVGENFDKVSAMIRDFGISHKVITDLMLLKDEHISMAAQIVANIYECYTATNAKLMENVRDLEIDLDKLATILGRLSGDTAHNKYSLISAITVLYNNFDVIKVEVPLPDKSGMSKHEVKIRDLTLTNRLCMNFDTKGANSRPKNDERLLAILKELQLVAKEYVAEKMPKAENLKKVPTPERLNKKITAADLVI